MAHDQMAAGTFLVTLPTLTSCIIVIAKVAYVREILIQILNFLELEHIWLYAPLWVFLNVAPLVQRGQNVMFTLE